MTNASSPESVIALVKDNGKADHTEAYNALQSFDTIIIKRFKLFVLQYKDKMASLLYSLQSKL